VEGKSPPYHHHVALGDRLARPPAAHQNAGKGVQGLALPGMLGGLPEDRQGSLELISTSGQRFCFHASPPRLQRNFASTLRSPSS